MPILIPILLVAAVAGYFIYQAQQKPATATTPATTATATHAAGAYAAMAQAGAFMQNRPLQDFRAHSPSVEDQVHGYGYTGQVGQYGLRPDLVRHGGAHVPVIEDQVAAAAMMYPHLGMHPMEQLNPTWMQIQQTQMPTAAQADLLKQVRLKNLRGFYKTHLAMQFFGLYVADPRDMKTYVWYVGPNIGRIPKNAALP